MNSEYTDILEKIGLTAPESRAYLALLELKEAKTGELCNQSNITSSNIYPILTSLKEKGLISYRMQNNTKIFMPSNPRSLNQIFEEKQKKLELEKRQMNQLISTLQKIIPSTEPESKYKYYEGISGIKAMWYGLIEDLNNLSQDEIVLVYTGKKEAYESLLGLYEDFHKVIMKRKIRYKVIYPKEEQEVSSKRKKQLAEVRFMDLDNEAEWGIIGNKLFIQYITKKVPRGFLIEDEIFAKAFQQVFEQVWKTAKE